MTGRSHNSDRAVPIRRRVVACALIGIGSLALAVAVMVPTYAMPRLKKIPVDITANTLSEAPDSTLVDAAAIAAGLARSESRVPLQFRVYVTTQEPSDADRVTVQAATTMTRADQPGQPPISATVDRVTLDRVTAMPVPDPPSAIAVVTTRPPDPTPQRAGLQYKFPFDVCKCSYPYFDTTSRTTNPVDYADDERVIGGMRAWRFHQRIGPINLRDGGQPEARLTLSASAWGLPDEEPTAPVPFDLYFTAERDVWVEPLSGSILAVEDHMHRFLARSPDDPHALTTLNARTRFSTETLDRTVELARDARTKLLAARYGPPVFAAAGAVLVAAGTVLEILARRRMRLSA